MTYYEGMEQLQAFARWDGMFIAALWTLSFVCFIANFVYPVFGLFALAIGAFSLVFASLRLRRFRDRVRDGRLPFLQAFGYSVLQYLHGSLLFAAVQFLYFQFLDKGFLVSQYQTVASTKEFAEAMAVYGLTKQDFSIVMENLAALRPVDIALQFFSTNVIMGIFLSLPIAVLMRR